MLKIEHFHNWLSPLPKHVLDKVREAMTVRELVDGEAIYHLGDEANELYQVLEGQIKCHMYSHDGKEVIIANFFSGDAFGEVGLLDGLPRGTNAYAIGATSVYALSKADFLRLREEHPEINAQLVIMFSHRLRMAYTLSTDNLTLTLRQRLARYLLRTVASKTNQHEKDVLIDASQEELTRVLVASRQSINKELKLMESEGLVEVKYGKILLKDTQVLAEQYEYLVGQEILTPDYQKSNTSN